MERREFHESKTVPGSVDRVECDSGRASAQTRHWLANVTHHREAGEGVVDRASTVIIADVNRLYPEKSAHALGNSEKFEYWKPQGSLGSPFPDKERVQRVAVLEREKQSLLSDLGLEATQPGDGQGI